MVLSFLEKLTLIGRLLCSSFLEIGLSILTLLFFLILVVNIKANKKVYNYLMSLIMIVFLGVVIYFNCDYVVYTVDIILKTIMKYIYFPSTAVYFMIVFLSVIFLVVTIFKNNLSNFKKGFNYLMFSLIFLMFYSFMAVVSTSKVDMMDTVSMYTNNYILSLVQISNVIFIFWLIITLFSMLYRFFKKKYDKEKGL